MKTLNSEMRSEAIKTNSENHDFMTEFIETMQVNDNTMQMKHEKGMDIKGMGMMDKVKTTE